MLENVPLYYTFSVPSRSVSLTFGPFLVGERRLLEAAAGRSGVHRKKINAWEQCVSMLGEPVTEALLPGKYNCITSSFCQNNSRRHCRTSTPSVFNDRTSFCLSKPKLGNVAVSRTP